MIHVVVRSITVGNIFHCQSADESDDAGIRWLEHPVDLLILLLELLNKRVDDDLYGIKHCSLHPEQMSGVRRAAQNRGHGAACVDVWERACAQFLGPCLGNPLGYETRWIMQPHSSFDRLIRPQSLWQATKHKHNASPVGNAQANTPEVFSVEPEDFPAAKHMCESSIDRESKFPISSRQHYCKGFEREIVRKQHKVPQTLSPRYGEQYKLIAGKAIQIAACQCCNTLPSV